MSNYFVETEGVVTDSLPGVRFRIQLSNGAKLLGSLSRQLRKNYVPVSVGDRVKVALRSYESTQGCIIYCIPSSKAA